MRCTRNGLLSGFILSFFVLTAYAQAQGDAGGLTAEELAFDATFDMAPVPVSQAQEIVLEGIAELSYQDQQGRFVVDVFERDRAYMGLRVSTPDGRPVQGAVPDISIQGSSSLLLIEPVSNEEGLISFGVVGGQMGMDSVVASYGEAKVEFAINVISLRAAGFEQPQMVEGAISWDDLMSARLEYDEKGMVASFPAAITEKAGESVKISGFMMPLQPDLKQSHFLLTSNPPSCFFHVPGGPAGSVEVMALEGIEVSWGPIILEGRFEPQERSEVGVVYRLLDAKVVKL